jgi:hypothetical protein
MRIESTRAISEPTTSAGSSIEVLGTRAGAAGGTLATGGADGVCAVIGAAGAAEPAAGAAELMGVAALAAGGAELAACGDGASVEARIDAGATTGVRIGKPSEEKERLIGVPFASGDSAAASNAGSGAAGDA